MKALILLLVIYSAWKVECFSEIIKIHDLQFNGNFSEIIYKTRITLAKYSSLDISLNETNISYDFSTLQAHCHHQQISMSIEIGTNESLSQYGTNIGFLLRPDNPEKLFKLVNNNNDDVQCIIALIAYPKSSPIPYSCEQNKTSSNIEMIKLIEEPNFLTAITPIKSCESSEITHETYYTYLDVRDFTADSYFDGIEKLLYDSITLAHQVKHLPIHNKHLFEKIPGRAIIINTAIKASNGKMTYLVPVASYSCAPNTWSSHCTDNNFVRKGFSIVLILFSIVMILNVMAPEFIESILNGMLFGGFGTIMLIKAMELNLHGFDYFITVIIGSFVVSAVLGFITIYFEIGQFLSKFTLSLFLMIFIMEICFDTITSAYLEVLFAMIISTILIFVPITCAAFIGCLLLILNISYLIKLSNLHRFMINNFLALTTLPEDSINETYFDFVRPNYINYYVSLNYIDLILIATYIAFSLYFTVRKEKFFFWHPEALRQSFMYNEFDQMDEERDTCPQARHDDYTTQYERKYDVEHREGIKRQSSVEFRRFHAAFGENAEVPKKREFRPRFSSAGTSKNSENSASSKPKSRESSKSPKTASPETKTSPKNQKSSETSPNREDRERSPGSGERTRPSSAVFDQIDVQGSTEMSK